MLKVLTIPQILAELDISKSNNVEGLIGVEALIAAADLRGRQNNHLELLLEDNSGLVVNYQCLGEDYVKMQEVLRYGISYNVPVKVVGKVYRRAAESVPHMKAESVSIRLNFNYDDPRPDFVNKSMGTEKKTINGYNTKIIRIDKENFVFYAPDGKITPSSFGISFLFTTEKDQS